MHGQDLHGLPSWTKDLETVIVGLGGALQKDVQHPCQITLWPEMWTNMSDAAQQWEKQKWAIEKPKLDNAWKLRGLYFVDPEDIEFKETLKNARKLEIPIEAVVPCKIRKRQHRETCCFSGNRKSKNCMHRGSRRIHQQAFGRNPTQWWWPHCRKRKSLSESWQTYAQVYSYAQSNENTWGRNSCG